MERQGMINKIVKEIKDLCPKETIVLGGSFAYGESLFNSDLDIYIIPNSIFKFRQIYNYKQLKRLVSKAQEQYRLRLEILIFPKLLLDLSFFHLHGKIIQRGMVNPEKYINKSDFTLIAKINSIKLGFRELIKAYLSSQPYIKSKSIMKAAFQAFIASIINQYYKQKHLFKENNLFNVKNLLLILESSDFLSYKEKQIIKEFLQAKAQGKVIKYEYSQFIMIRNLLNKLYLKARNTFIWQNYLLYNLKFIIRNRNFRFLFHNPDQLVLEAAYHLANSIDLNGIDQGIKRCIYLLSKIALPPPALDKKEWINWAYKILEKNTLVILGI